MGSQFMQQFMAGWQMGQGRNENTRRNQELEMERARQEQMLRQRAEEFELQKEEFAVRKKQLAAQEAAHKLSAAQEARKLREEASYLQGMPAPTAAEAGIQQTTPQDVGPTMDQINVPQPTQAMPDPTGGADIQMPILTGRQQQEMAQAEQQKKMREALGLLEAQEGIKAQYRQSERPVSVAPGARLVDPKTGNVIFTAPERPDGSSGGGGGITPNQEAALVDKLGKNWQALSKDVTTMRRQASMMDSGLAAAKRGDLAAGSQAVLVTFQKILDPTSVVRESEYARSAAGQALLARIEGAFDQVQRGGAGVPISELEKFASLAKEFIAKSESGLQGERTRIGKIADRYKIPKDLIFSDDTLSPGGGAAPAGGDYEPTAVPGVRRRKVQR